MTIIQIFGVLGGVIALISQVGYVLSIYKGQTQGNPYAYTIWLLLQIVFLVTFIIEDAWYASLYIIVEFLAIIAGWMLVVADKQSDRTFDLTNKISFIGALMAIGLLIFIKDPLWALVIAMLADILGFVIVLRKTWENPNSEHVNPWLLGMVAHICIMLSLPELSFTLLAFPVLLFLENSSVVLTVTHRKRVLKTNDQSLLT